VNIRKYLVRSYGGPEHLHLEECVEPEPGPGEVRVATRAISINFADLIQRVGQYPNQPPLPFTPGMEAAGVVDAVGQGCDKSLVGKRVMAVPIYGSHAEKFCLPEDYAMEMPEGVDWDEGAAFSVAFLTAYYALHELGRARKGEVCIISAAAGGVGTALVQLAKLAGLEVVAVVGSESKRELPRSLGADHVVDYASCAKLTGRLWPDGIDLVLDSVGGTFFRPLWKQLNKGGRYILYGFAEVGAPKGISYLRAARGLASMGFLKPYDLVTANRTLAGFNLSVVPNQVQLLRRYAADMLAIWGRGEVRPILGKHFAFEELPEAHRYVASRASTGRVIIRV
jgi:NADPH2:quinone reductase